MSNLPENIWVIKDNVNIWLERPYPLAAQIDPPVEEYIRADVAREQIDTLVESLRLRRKHNNEIVERLNEQSNQIEDLSNSLLEVLWQACSTREASADDSMDSFGISAYADGMRQLAKLGKVEVEVDVGRRVICHIK